MSQPAFWTRIGEQLKRPEGRLGKLAGHAMQLSNAKANTLAVDALAPRPGERFAELGCGPGQALKRILACGAASVIGIDHSEVMIAQARRNNAAALEDGRLALLGDDFTALPLEDANTDGVLAVNVAYFMRDAAAIVEAHRVLRPGGRLVLYVTSAASMRNWRFAGPHSHRLFDTEQLLALLTAGGFTSGNIIVSSVVAGAGVAGFVVTARRARQEF